MAIPNTDVTRGTMDMGTRAQLWDGLNSQKKFFIGNQIHELNPDETPFLTMLGRIPQISMDGTDKAFVEHRSAAIDNRKFGYVSGLSAMSAAAAGDSFTVVLYYTGASVVTNQVPVGSIIQVIDDNNKSQVANLLVTAVSSGTNLTCLLLTNAPGFNPTAVASYADSTAMVYLRSNAFGEGAATATAEYELADTRWFGTQIFKDMFEISGSLEASKDIIYGSELEFQMRNVLRRHKSKMDKAFLHSSARLGAVAGDPWSAPVSTLVNAETPTKRVPTTMSLLQACRAATTYGMGGTRIFTNTASSMTYGDLLDNLQEQFEFHAASDTKMAFAGAGFLTNLNKLALRTGEYQLKSGETSFGLKCYILDSPHGQLQIMRHIGMRDEFTNAMAVVDPANIALGTFRPTSWRGLPITTDSKQVEYLTEAGLMVRLPETHGFWFFL